MSRPLTIAYLYPSEMNIYGDRGNIIALQQRCRWRGIDTKLDEIHLGQTYDFARADLIFGGGGQDRGQELVAQDLQRHGEAIKLAVAKGTPALVVCGLYQLFGRRFVTGEGAELPGIGLFAAETIAKNKRMIGNIIIQSDWGQLVGFENHSGQTKLDHGESPLGSVKKGFGNDGHSKQEGARRNNAIGTYLHGPILPKNPALADFLIASALKHNSGHSEVQLKPLDDSLEAMAAAAAANRPK